ncbi:MAG: translation initiation factor [Spirochaetes bacterium]|nr:translation initiation factor [Spirochaetota bacterium]
MERGSEVTMADRIVYSTERGDLRGAYEGGRSAGKKPGAPSDGTVRVRRETKGRGGKTVTVVYGLLMTGERLASFAAAMKRACGTGGTVKDGAVIIQGDKIDAVIGLIEAQGLKVRRSGG